MGTQEGGVVHHHLLPGGGVEEIVARNPRDSGRRAGDDRGVVDGGKGWHSASSQATIPRGRDFAKPWHPSSIERGVEILVRGPIQTDHDELPVRWIVAAIIDDESHLQALFQKCLEDRVGDAMRVVRQALHVDTARNFGEVTPGDTDIRKSARTSEAVQQVGDPVCCFIRRSDPENLADDIQLAAQVGKASRIDAVRLYRGAIIPQPSGDRQRDGETVRNADR